MKNKYLGHYVGTRFSVFPYLIMIVGCVLLVGCDNNPAPASPTATAALAPTATTRAALPTVAPASPTTTAMLPTVAPSATLITTLTVTSVPLTTPAACPTVGPPPTLTPVPTPRDYVPGTPQTGLPTDTLHIRTSCRIVTLKVAVASTGVQQVQGLMGVTNLPQDEGMMFDFGTNNSTASFWMKDTPLPLSIAFITGDQYIVGLDEMVAFDDKNFISSPSPYRYAVEANADFFTRYGVQVGDKVEIVKQ